MGSRGVLVAGLLAMAAPVGAEMKFEAMDAVYSFDSQEGIFTGVGGGHGVDGRMWVQVVDDTFMAGQWSLGDDLPKPVQGISFMLPLVDDGVVDRWEVRFELEQGLAWWAWVGAGAEGPFGGGSYLDRVVPLHSYLVTDWSRVPYPPAWAILTVVAVVLWLWTTAQSLLSRGGW